MKRKEWVIIAVTSLIIGLLLFFQLFSIQEVPDVRWRENYRYNSKQPYGGWMFNELVRERFSDIPVIQNVQDTSLSSIESSGNLLVMLGSTVRFNWLETTELVNFVRKGNDVLIITEHLDLDPDLDIDYPYADAWTDVYDTTVAIRYEGQDEDFIYKHHHGDFKKASYKYFSALSPAMIESEQYISLGKTSDSLLVYAYWPLDEGRILLHTIPSLFSNLAAKQPFYLEHFNFIFSQFDPNLVIIDHMVFHEGGGAISQSPLQFILSNQSLRISYFLLLFTALSYVLFKSKRRQKVIPTLAVNVNSSLEYVHTMSSLFQQQGQHKKLIRHLEQIFDHYIKGRYFIDRHDKNFFRDLVRKSRVPPEEVSELLSEFERANKKLNVGDDHLISLHRRLQSFYKKCK